MNEYVSLLRGINVGGHNKIKMVELVDLYKELGFTQVKTYIQSGNVIFESPNENVKELENQIKDRIRSALGLDIQIVIRTAAELEEAISNNPFGDKDLKNVYVMFLSESPADYSTEGLRKVKADLEEFIISEKVVYVYYHNSAANTKLTNNLFEKNLKINATTRNWNTVNKLYQMMKD